ncbi:hypothetical protein [Amycolatopsis sp. EV170708-02-1]|uniref:hypothetical protein n=1 Tax=Amycolatopsis sp. EV170708-02-1 TaxID=2919322 RepID=UPI001F0BFAB3|nr:hypothetical protein [Amycolatopsis sp. EV170708-02-1]UMP01370.1 hypothetical protein MJQ72_33790 [Amycolatopsis sp. EV170708-02-1]
MTKMRGISRTAGAVLFACLAIAGCGGDPQPPAPVSSQAPATGAAYPMPAGWPLTEFPLPPGGTAPAPRASDTVVSFRIDGVDTESAKGFYAETLPGLGYADTHNANLAIARYEGNGVKILVQDEQTGSARVTITKSAG